jgi:hypothetical protein
VVRVLARRLALPRHVGDVDGGFGGGSGRRSAWEERLAFKYSCASLMLSPKK